MAALGTAARRSEADTLAIDEFHLKIDAPHDRLVATDFSVGQSTP
jgi:hypothetical protein